MRVMVTGSHGFIGKNLIKFLSKKGHKTVGVDLKKRINQYRAFDITTPLPEFVWKGLDAVVHLAAISDIQTAEKDVSKTMEVNLEGTINIMKDAERTGVKRFIFASSAAVYGDTIKGSLANENDFTNPRGVYGRSKLFGEELCKLYNKREMKTIALRFFNVYGPGQTNGLIGKLSSATKTNPLEIYGDGKNRRDYVHVDDVSQAIMSALCIDDKKAFGKAYNIGTGKTYNIWEVLETAIKYREIPVIQKDEMEETSYSCANTSRATKRLNWIPTIDLDTGLKRLLC